MTAGSKGGSAPIVWGAHGGRRGHAPLRLLGALRGSGSVRGSGEAVAAAYEIDVFGAGMARSASGALEGDFDALLGTGEVEDVLPMAGHLRLEDGEEVAIEIVGLEAHMAQFEVAGADASRLWPADRTSS